MTDELFDACGRTSITGTGRHGEPLGLEFTRHLQDFDILAREHLHHKGGYSIDPERLEMMVRYSGVVMYLLLSENWETVAYVHGIMGGEGIKLEDWDSRLQNIILS